MFDWKASSPLYTQCSDPKKDKKTFQLNLNNIITFCNLLQMSTEDTQTSADTYYLPLVTLYQVLLLFHRP